MSKTRLSSATHRAHWELLSIVLTLFARAGGRWDFIAERGTELLFPRLQITQIILAPWPPLENINERNNV